MRLQEIDRIGITRTYGMMELTAVLPPKMTMPWSGSRSMMILNVSQMFARANQEKISEKILYYSTFSAQRSSWSKSTTTYQCLDVEEEHANNAMARPVESEEVHNGVLCRYHETTPESQVS